MNSYLKLAVNADKNRVRFNFVDAVHVINNINISDYSVLRAKAANPQQDIWMQTIDELNK